MRWRGNMDQKVADMVAYDELVVPEGNGRKAILVRWGDQKEWIPLSQIINHDKEGRALRLKYWIVEQKGLEDLIEEESYA